MTSVAVTLASVGIGLLAPWPLKIVVDSVLGSEPYPDALVNLVGSRDRVVMLGVVVAGGLVLTLLANALSVLNSYLQTRLEQSIVLDFKSDLFRHAERLSVAYRDQVSTGRLMYGINFEAAAAGGLILSLQPLAQGALTLLGMVWISFRIDRDIALLSITVVPLLYYAIRLLHDAHPAAAAGGQGHGGGLRCRSCTTPCRCCRS